MKTRVLLILLALTLVLSACSDDKKQSKEGEIDKGNLENLNETGFPIVKESISFDVFTSPTSIDTNWNDILFWNKYNEMTNIDVDWEQIPSASVIEKRNLTLASDDLPDAFYASGLTSQDLFKYGQQGTFIKLNDLIEEYAPNLTRLMEKYPEVRQTITFPDGNIYSMPTIRDPESLSLLIGAGPWFQRQWLEQLEMELPETTDEFYQYLKAVKETDLNGNEKADEIPYGGRNISELIRWLRGAFGISEQNQVYIDLDKENQVRFVPATKEYKEMLVYIRKLYEEGLINSNIFTIEGDQFLSQGSDQLYGSTSFYSPEATFGLSEDVYIGGLPLKGPEGHQLFSKNSIISRIDGLVLTRKNENPAAMIKWIDYFYSDEGARFQYMGIENETYVEKEDGTFSYVDDIVNSPDGLTMDQEIRKRLTWNGISPPGLMKQEYFLGAETTKSSLEATEKLAPYFSNTTWPTFSYLEEEMKVLASVGADLEKYADEMRDKFIIGDMKESEWDSYLKTLESIGLEKYLKVQQAAYERYVKN